MGEGYFRIKEFEYRYCLAVSGTKALRGAWYGNLWRRFDGDLALASRSTRLFWSAARGDLRYAVLGYSQLQVSFTSTVVLTM